MMDNITLSRDDAREVFKALNGIGELLKALRPRSESAAVMYAITSNLTVIRMKLAGIPRVNSN